MSRSAIMLISLLILVLILGTIGCGGEEAGGPNVLKVGVTQPLTGPAVAWGITMRDTNMLLMEKINDAGGIVVGGETYLIKAIYEDDKYTPEGGRTAAEKLIFRDKVKVILHHGGSPPAAAIQPIAEANGVLMISCTWDPAWLGEPNKYTFGTLPDVHMLSGALYKYVHEEYPDVKTQVQLCQRGPTESRQLEPAKEMESQSGITTIGEAIFDTGTVDFTSVLAPLLVKNPDMLSLHGSEGDTTLLIRQARELGYDGIIVLFNPFDVSVMLDVVGATYGEGVITYYNEPVTDWGKQFKAEFEAGYGYFDASSMTPCIAPVVEAFFAGVEAADSVEPAKIAAALEGLQFETVNGPAQFGGKGKYGAARLLYSPMQIRQFNGSEFKLVATISADVQMELLDAVWPPAY